MFDREPLLVGVLVSSLEKAFRVVDIGPSAENKEEVIQVFSCSVVSGTVSYIFLICELILSLIHTRL